MRIDSGALKARLMNNPDAMAAIEELEDQAKRMGEAETVDLALTFGYGQDRVVGRVMLADTEVVELLVHDGRYELSRWATLKRGKQQLLGIAIVPMVTPPSVKGAQIDTSPPLCKTPLEVGHSECVFFCIHEIDKTMRERRYREAMEHFHPGVESDGQEAPPSSLPSEHQSLEDRFTAPCTDDGCGCTGHGA